MVLFYQKIGWDICASIAIVIITIMTISIGLEFFFFFFFFLHYPWASLGSWNLYNPEGRNLVLQNKMSTFADQKSYRRALYSTLEVELRFEYLLTTKAKHFVPKSHFCALGIPLYSLQPIRIIHSNLLLEVDLKEPARQS